MNFQQALKGKVAGVPVPVIAIGLGAIIWLVFFRGRQSTTSNAAAAGSQLSSGYGLGYAQGLQAAMPPAPVAGIAKSLDSAFDPANWVQAGSGFQYTGSQPLVINGQRFQPLADWPAAINAASSGSKVYYFASPGQPVEFGPAKTGIFPQGFRQVSLYGTQPIAQGGVGIGGPKSIGSRSANLMHYAHPLVKARVPYEYHVRKVGGEPRHAREVHRVAQQSGVHPARLMALNPRPESRHIRVA